MPTTTGKNRLFGPLVQGRIHELRRQAGVALSETAEEATAAGSFPRHVSVLREAPAGSAQSSIGLDTTWSAVAGLTDLVAHVRTAGRWRDEAAGRDIDLRADERSVLVYDVPEAGTGGEGDVLLTDCLRFTDPTYGDSIWTVKEVRPRKASGQVNALVRWERQHTEDVG
jgi:hypothetical protein